MRKDIILKIFPSYLSNDHEINIDGKKCQIATSFGTTSFTADEFYQIILKLYYFYL